MNFKIQKYQVNHWKWTRGTNPAAPEESPKELFSEVKEDSLSFNDPEMKVYLTSPNYFQSFVPRNELFEYDPSLVSQGDPEHFDKYFLSEDDSDLDEGLEFEDQVEEVQLFSQQSVSHLNCIRGWPSNESVRAAPFAEAYERATSQRTSLDNFETEELRRMRSPTSVFRRQGAGICGLSSVQNIRWKRTRFRAK